MQNTNNFDNYELRQLKNPTFPTLFSQQHARITIIINCYY